MKGRENDNLFLLILTLIILIARGSKNSDYFFIILMTMIAFGANGELDFLG